MTAANLCTAARLGLAPVFVLVFLAAPDSLWSLIPATAVAILFEVTDGIDGKLARSRGEMTAMGKLFDPFADSVARFSVFLAFYAHPAGYADLWMVFVFFYRDSTVSFLRILAAAKNHVMGARTSGKVKAWAQGIAILTTLGLSLFHRIGILGWIGLGSLPIPTIGRVLVGAAAVVTLYSLADYLRGALA
ncbi:MAG: CDP-alcohol phosphatidyltransferase family protein, partial [Planctomycetes bacterium]|nr:CDP-alcohol phosphatidyltransferase family protein [Planctomycetota bacterium]